MTVFFDADEEQAIATVWYMQTRRKGQEAQFRNMRRAGWLIAAIAAFMALLLFLKFSPLALLMAFLYSAMAALFIRQEPIQRKLVAQAVKAGAARGRRSTRSPRRVSSTRASTATGFFPGRVFPSLK